MRKKNYKKHRLIHVKRSVVKEIVKMTSDKPSQTAVETNTIKWRNVVHDAHSRSY